MSSRYAIKWLLIGAVVGALCAAAWASLDIALGVSTIVASRALLLVGMTAIGGLIVGAGQIVWRRFWSRW